MFNFVFKASLHLGKIVVARQLIPKIHFGVN